MEHFAQCSIRRATPDDAEVVIQGIDAICVEGGAFYVKRFVPTAQWQTVLYQPSTAPEHLIVVAEWRGQFVGAGRLFRGESNTLFQHVAELGMFVLKPYRRQGVGKSLLTWMITWAASTGIEKIALNVFASNLPAIHLYRQLGFIEEGCQRRHLKVNDQYIDRLWMALFLQQG